MGSCSRGIGKPPVKYIELPSNGANNKQEGGDDVQPPIRPVKKFWIEKKSVPIKDDHMDNA